MMILRPSLVRLTVLVLALSCYALLPAQAQNSKASKPAPSSLPGAQTEIYKTIGDVSLPIHIFKPVGHQARDSRPAIVFFFGGGWRSGSPEQFAQQCAYLASRGMVAMTAEYRVANRHGVKAVTCFSDAKSAIRWARANAKRLGIDPKRIAAGGGSAGGHLAGALGTIKAYDDPNDNLSVSAVPNALALFNPALVLAPVAGENSMDAEKATSLEQRMGVPLESFSPYHNIHKNQPPTIIFHGLEDPTVPHATSELFATKSRSKGNRCELVSYEGQKHGFFNYGKGDNIMFQATVTEMDRFFKSLGYLKGKPRVQAFLESNE
jgi:acetyl esterase/lipase